MPNRRKTFCLLTTHSQWVAQAAIHTLHLPRAPAYRRQANAADGHAQVSAGSALRRDRSLSFSAPTYSSMKVCATFKKKTKQT